MGAHTLIPALRKQRIKGAFSDKLSFTFLQMFLTKRTANTQSTCVWRLPDGGNTKSRAHAPGEPHTPRARQLLIFLLSARGLLIRPLSGEGRRRKGHTWVCLIGEELGEGAGLQGGGEGLGGGGSEAREASAVEDTPSPTRPLWSLSSDKSDPTS